MPTVVLSPIGNDAPFVDASGNPLSGGLLYFYDAGTTTPQATYTTIAGSVQNANPVVLNANGYPASGGNVVSIWMIDGADYKVELQTSAGVPIWTRDNITGVNDSNVSLTAATQAQQEAGSITTAYTSPARQQYHPSAPKAWARIVLTATVPSVGLNYNVASVTDGGVGAYTVNFTVALSAANYPPIGSVDAGAGAYVFVAQPNAVGGTVVNIYDSAAPPALVDQTFFFCQLGDQ